MTRPLRVSRIYDLALETQNQATRAAFLSGRLAETVRLAYAHASRARAQLDAAGVKPVDIRNPNDLQRLPIIRKDALAGIQAQDLPFGGLNAISVEKLARIFMSPGNIYDPQGDSADFWRFAPALTAAGFRAGDLVQNTFSYHMTPAGFMFDSALRHLGCVVIPAGVGQTDLQVRMAADLGVMGYIGTPSFLHTLLTKAQELNTPLKIEVAFVTGEMFAPSLRSELESDFGGNERHFNFEWRVQFLCFGQ